jgi:hypothetical protein
MTDPTELFVHRYDELVDLSAVADDIRALRIAGVLRQLFIDGTPLVHLANREQRLRLQFSINDVPPLAIPGATVLLTSALLPSAGPFGGAARSVKLNDFLSTWIIQHEARRYTVHDVIDFAANKAGGVHLDRRGTEGSSLAVALSGLETLGVQPLVLALQAIAAIAVEALQPLRSAICGLHSGFPVWGYYKVPRSGGVSFERNQALASLAPLELAHGFSFNAILRLSVQAGRGERVLYQLGNESRDPLRFTVLTDGARRVRCVVNLGRGKVLRCEGEVPRRTTLLDHFSYVGAQLCFRQQATELSLNIGGVEVAHDQTEIRADQRSVSRQALGADIWNRRSASFDIRELILADWCLSDEERRALLRYLYLEWHA